MELFQPAVNIVISFTLTQSNTVQHSQPQHREAGPATVKEINPAILDHFLGRIMFPISSLFHALKSRVSLNYIRVTTF